MLFQQPLRQFSSIGEFHRAIVAGATDPIAFGNVAKLRASHQAADGRKSTIVKRVLSFRNGVRKRRRAFVKPALIPCEMFVLISSEDYSDRQSCSRQPDNDGQQGRRPLRGRASKNAGMVVIPSNNESHSCRLSHLLCTPASSVLALDRR